MTNGLCHLVPAGVIVPSALQQLRLLGMFTLRRATRKKVLWRLSVYGIDLGPRPRVCACGRCQTSPFLALPGGAGTHSAAVSGGGLLLLPPPAFATLDAMEFGRQLLWLG